jgi:hypothetical protein
MRTRPPFGTHELDVEAISAAEERSLVALGRELEAVDPGESRQGLAFADAIMTAIRAEATPRPSAAWVASLRRRRPLRTVAALRDSFRVAFGPASRPLGARLAAVPVALATLLLVGSVGVAGAGAVGVRLPDSATPPPTAPAVGPTTRPSRSAEPSESPEPSEAVESPERSSEPEDSRQPRSTDAPRATARPTVRDTPEPSEHETAEPSDHETAEPSETPEPGDTSEPGDG